MLRLYGAYKEEGNLAVDVSFLIDPEGFVGDVCNFLVGKPLIFAALTFEYTLVPGEHGLVTGKEDNPPPSSLVLAQGSARIMQGPPSPPMDHLPLPEVPSLLIL